jgi:hypothetical protein
MKTITSRKPESIVIESGEEILYDMSQWPESSPGQPYRKSEVLWDEVNEVIVLKTQAQLDSENALKQLVETDKEMNRKLEDHVDLLISKGLVEIEDYPVQFQEVYNLRKELRTKLI